MAISSNNVLLWVASANSAVMVNLYAGLPLINVAGWNEETITDDLDLTIRLHLDDWKIGFLLDPAVQEEGRY